MYTILIPAYNEEKTVRKVLKIAMSAPNVGQILLVDDGSTDKTLEKATGLSPLIDIISHRVNKGKGAAVRTGIALAKFENVLFLDADLVNITADKIYALVEPLLKNEADFVKASFSRARGRVTEMAVKPMMQILFPNNYFEQPISGQFAAKLSFLKEITIVENWGLDIGILLDAISKKLRIIEVFIGELDHKAQSDHSLATMSEQVLYTMIQKAGLLSSKYKLILFAFDESLIKNYSLLNMMKFVGKEKEFTELEESFTDKEILPLEYYTHVAQLLEGVSVDALRKYANTLELRTYAADIIERLQSRRFKVGIIGMHFEPIVKVIAAKLKVEHVESLGIKVKDKVCTGELTRKSTLQWFSTSLQQGYFNAMNLIAKEAKTDLQSTIAVMSGPESLPMVGPAGLSVAYRSKDKGLKKAADKTISILPELLMLVE
jgi:glycosyltransferase involved in cell wall biosynthesis